MFEYYPVTPIGTFCDIRVAGENYGRGLCGQVLPDVAVLNTKKRRILQTEAKILESPILQTGQGMNRKWINDFEPNEVETQAPRLNFGPSLQQ